MFRGNSATIQLTAQLGGVPFNITGCTLTFSASSASPAASLSGTTADGSVSITNGPLGQAIFPITPAMTSGFPNQNFTMTYQWVLTDLTGKVTTLEEGTLAIRRNI